MPTNVGLRRHHSNKVVPTALTDGAERAEFLAPAGVRKSARNEPAGRLIKLNRRGGSNRQFVLTSQFGAMVEQLLAE